MSHDADAWLSRRTAMAAIGAGATTLLNPRFLLAAEESKNFEIARGVVFDDRSGCGRRRAGDPGMPGVLVSNGCDVVATDDAGRWALPVAPGDGVFVIEPPHWSCRLDRGIAAGAYLHQPHGTPPSQLLRTNGAGPTGLLPDSIEFALQRRRQAALFEALLLADTQAATLEELSYVRRDLMALAGSGAAFAIHHGDAMGDDLALLAPYRRILAETGMTWRHCPGNHDLNLDARDPAFGFDAWKQHIGPTHSAFQYAGALFILLNNVDFFGRDGVSTEGRRYRGHIGARQLRFVETLLRHIPDETLVVVSMHIPLVSFDAPNSRGDTTDDRAALLRLLAKRRHAISFAGHSHTTEHHYLGREHGFERDEPHHHHVLTAASGSWWSGPRDAHGTPTSESRDGSPRGYHVLSVDGVVPRTRFEPFADEENRKLRLMVWMRNAPPRPHRGPILRDRLADALILANVFDGGPETRVELEISGRGEPPIAMTRSTVTDPHIVESFARHRALCKPWVTAAPSSHIWTAPAPLYLKAGVHHALVRVTGESGGAYATPFAFEIAG